jgi:hypothetical protein
LQDVGIICEQLPSLAALNLSNNSMSHEIVGLPLLKSIHILVLNNTGINWTQVNQFFCSMFSLYMNLRKTLKLSVIFLLQIEVLKDLLPVIEELHLMGNGINAIKVVFVEYPTLFLKRMDNMFQLWAHIRLLFY